MSRPVPSLWGVYLARFPAQIFRGGRLRRQIRPVAVVSDASGGKVSVVPLSGREGRKDRSAHIQISGCGRRKHSWALCELVTTLSTKNLAVRLGTITEPYDRYAIRHALAEHLGIPEITNW